MSYYRGYSQPRRRRRKSKPRKRKMKAQSKIILLLVPTAIVFFALIVPMIEGCMAR